MKKFAVWIGILGVATASVAQAKGPSIEIKESVYEFGESLNDKIIEHFFEIGNKGDAELILHRAKASCGCTVADIPKKNLAPGETVKIKVSVNLQGRRGPQNKAVLVTCNDPLRPSISLTVKGVAIALLYAQPPRLTLGAVAHGKTLERVVKIGSEHKSFKILGARCENPHVKWDIEPADEEGMLYTMTVTLLESAPLGKFNAPILIKSDLRPSDEFAIPVIADLAGALAIQPEKLVLPKGTKPLSRYVTIRPGHVKRFRIIKIDPPDPDIVSRVMMIGTVGYRIQINKIIPSEELNGKVMKIYTDSKDAPVIEIPFVIN